ncbi:MAG TPA: DUF1648 domain-containing protein [Longimicrobiales bacterium]
MPLRIDATLLVVIWLFALGTYRRLPDSFPIHFDLAGNADGFAERGTAGFVLWLLLPTTATLLSLFMRWAARAGWKNPHLWNVPHKKQFVALSPERRAPAQGVLAEAMAWLTLLCSALLATLEWLIYVSARAAHMPAMPTTVLLFVFVVVIVVYGHRSSGRARKAIEEAVRDSPV